MFVSMSLHPWGRQNKNKKHQPILWVWEGLLQSQYIDVFFLMVLQSFKNVETNSLDSCGGVFFFFADACFNDSPMTELFPFF